MPLSREWKNNNISEEEKKSCPRFFNRPRPYVFLIVNKKIVMEGVFDLVDKGKPLFEYIKADVFRWSLAVK